MLTGKLRRPAIIINREWCYLENGSKENIYKCEETLLTLYGSFKKGLARFAGRDAIMEPTRHVPADQAKPSGYHVLLLDAFLKPDTRSWFNESRNFISANDTRTSSSN